MAKRKKQQPAVAPPRAQGLTITVLPRWTRLVLPIAAIGAATLCLVIGFLGRYNLNPDGVSYLDLARVFARGDLHHFVQGYWSPLLSLVMAPATLVVGPPTMIVIAHALNVGCCVIAVLILSQWSRREIAANEIAGRIFAAAAFAVFLLCSFTPPRVEALTPDVILLLLTVALSHELIAYRGTRWVPVGALLGATFLAKTSAWPWLLATIAIRLIAATDTAGRRRVLQSAAVAAAVMLVWVVPMSLRYHQFTLGSSGRLNYDWYIDANSSRLPDTDLGSNAAYRTVRADQGVTFPIAHFDDSDVWTYEPWGDPTAWHDGELSETGRLPTFVEITSYWLRDLKNSFVLWLGPMLLSVSAALYLLQRRAKRPGAVTVESRDAAAVAIMGLIGVLQFVAVHTEPRLIAPFGAMLGLGMAAWYARRVDRDARLDLINGALASSGLLVAFGIGIAKTIADARDYDRIQLSVAQLEQIRQHFPVSTAPPTLAILGPAAPVIRVAYWLGARVVLQLPPRSISAISVLPPLDQRATVLGLLGSGYSAVWQTNDAGEIRVLAMPPR